MTGAVADARAAACAHRNAVATRLSPRTARAAVLCEINSARARAGLRPLVPDARLALAARRHARDMVARRYFDHVSLDGRDVVRRVRDAGYLRRSVTWSISEVIGWAEAGAATPAVIVAAWLNSPPHREAILSPVYLAAGVGIAAGTPRADLPRGATFDVDVGAVRCRLRSGARWRSPTTSAAHARASRRPRAACGSTSTRSGR
ncbi:MAG TPA: CAP domain-containing protein [Solirubrobacteraceae bacterium]|nr:CAP domain-containing protein [Solirubrobacteraceae bacterium]